MEKKELRKWAKAKRIELDMESISTILVNKLVQTKEYKKSKNIMIFYPMPDEVNLLTLLNDNEKNFYLPRINGKELECCPYKNNDELCESCLHTLEPTCDSCSKTVLDMVIAPALACDKCNFRLGYGGGFYDRFLKNFSGTTVVCIPKELVTDTIYPKEHDIKMDLIITNS